MNWLVGIGLFALVGICSYFGIEHHLDSKANKLSQGNEEDRRDADAQAYRNFCGALDWFSLSVGGVGVSRGGVEFVPVDAGPVCGRDAVVRFGRRCLFALPQGVGDE